MQGMLFHQSVDDMLHSFNSAALQLPGLDIVYDFIEPEVETALIDEIDLGPWDTSISRRMQHYGYRYEIRKKKNEPPLQQVAPMPVWLAPIALKLKAAGVFRELANQAHINEYLPGQGIALHTDLDEKFKHKIAILSLGSGIAFQLEDEQKQTYEIYLPQRSLLLMSDDVRYHYRHGIAKRKSDVILGQKLPRGRRLAVIFRQASL